MEASDALQVAATAGLPATATSFGGGAPRLVADDVRLAVAHRVQGLVWLALDTGVVVADDRVMELARDAQMAALRTCLVAEEAGLLALDVLASAGLDARALKGIAIAHLDHPNPAERVFGDADVLIRPADLDRALKALDDGGFERLEPPVRGWWERRFGKAVVLRAPNGGELDLHLRVAAGYFGERIGPDPLRAGRDQLELAGRTVDALGPEGRLVQACAHAVVGGGSGLRALRDVAQLVLVTGADWAAVAADAREGGFDGIVSTAIGATWSELRLDQAHPAATWAQHHEVPPAQMQAISASTTADTTGWSAEGFGALGSLDPLDRVRLLAGLAWPSRASLRARGRTRRQHLRRSLAALRDQA